MPITTKSTLLLNIQDDLQALLLNDPLLAPVAILQERKGVSLNDLQETLGPLNARAGKRGLAAVVRVPRVSKTQGAQPESAPFQLLAGIDFLENRVINQNPTTGTGLSVEEVALRALTLLHGYRAGPGSGGLYLADRDAVEPLKLQQKGWVGFRVQITAAGAAPPAERAPAPRAVQFGSSPTTLQFTSPNPAAHIHYTTNGSWPDPAQSSTFLHTSPLLLTGPLTVRAVALLEPLLPSHCTTVEINA
jgi:hypothetical protein